MKKFTQSIFALALMLMGAVSMNAATLDATFGTPANEGAWDAETNTYSWTKSYSNLMPIFTFENGELAKYESLHLTTADYTNSYRVCFMEGSTVVATIKFYSEGQKDLVFAERDETKEIDLSTVTTISFGGNSGSGSIVLTDVYLENSQEESTEGEKVYATFENPTGITWDAESMTFSWSSQWGNQLHNIGLPNGNLSEYETLVIDCEILEGDGYRFMFYSNQKGTTAGGLTIVTESGKHEYLLSEFDMDAVYLTDCSEICLSGYNGSGKVKVNEVYLVKSTDKLANYKTELSKLMAQAVAFSSLGKTEESFEALQAALQAAQEAIDAEDATVESLTEATEKLQAAIEGLELKSGFVALEKDMFFVWDGAGKDAQKTEDGTYFEDNVMKNVGQGGTVWGNGNVAYLQYADLSDYDVIYVAGTVGATVRFLMNRETDGGALLEFQVVLDENGLGEVDLKNGVDKDGKSIADAGFVHLNAVKLPWNGLTVMVTDLLVYSEDIDTGITNLSPLTSHSSLVYDLQGRRVAQPQKGLYIINGKKVLVK